MTCKSAVYLKDEKKLALELIRLIIGWSNYFNHSNATQIYNGLWRFIGWKFVKFMCLDMVT